jgi:hypothetical protein
VDDEFPDFEFDDLEASFCATKVQVLEVRVGCMYHLEDLRGRFLNVTKIAMNSKVGHSGSPRVTGGNEICMPNLREIVRQDFLDNSPVSCEDLERAFRWTDIRLKSVVCTRFEVNKKRISASRFEHWLQNLECLGVLDPNTLADFNLQVGELNKYAANLRELHVCLPTTWFTTIQLLQSLPCLKRLVVKVEGDEILEYSNAKAALASLAALDLVLLFFSGWKSIDRPNLERRLGIPQETTNCVLYCWEDDAMFDPESEDEVRTALASLSVEDHALRLLLGCMRMDGDAVDLF